MSRPRAEAAKEMSQLMETMRGELQTKRISELEARVAKLRSILNIVVSERSIGHNEDEVCTGNDNTCPGCFSLLEAQCAAQREALEGRNTQLLSESNKGWALAESLRTERDAALARAEKAETSLANFNQWVRSNERVRELALEEAAKVAENSAPTWDRDEIAAAIRAMGAK